MKKVMIIPMLVVLPLLFSTIVLANTFCYQESANVSTACGGLDSGVYFVNGSLPDYWQTALQYPQYAIDGNWSSFAFGKNDSFIDINYTKPTNALSSSLWMIKLNSVQNEVNITVPLDCWNKYTDRVSFRMQSRCTSDYNVYDCLGDSAFCYNGTWKVLWTDVTNGSEIGYGSLYEEAMYWDGDFTPPIINITSPTNTTYQVKNAWFNLTLNEDGSWCGYSLNNNENITMSESPPPGGWDVISVQIGFNNSFYNVSFSCNDTSGNMNLTSPVYFTINCSCTAWVNTTCGYKVRNQERVCTQDCDTESQTVSELTCRPINPIRSLISGDMADFLQGIIGSVIVLIIAIGLGKSYMKK